MLHLRYLNVPVCSIWLPLSTVLAVFVESLWNSRTFVFPLCIFVFVLSCDFEQLKHNFVNDLFIIIIIITTTNYY